MDNVTHSLAGYALARSGLDRLCPRAIALLVLSANAPDGDIVALAGGRFAYFEAHRGYSHSLLCLPFLALFTALVVSALFRERLPWTRAWLLCCVGVASHLLIDWTNNYGIRMLLPFSSRWLHLDLNSLYDGWILAALAFAALWPVLAGLVGREIGEKTQRSRGPALFALSFFVLFDAGRALLHQRVLSQLQARLFDNEPAINIAAFPLSSTPFRWNGVVETEDSYFTIPVDALGDLHMETLRKYFKPPTEELQAVTKIQTFQYFLYFARFPVWSIAPVITASGEWKRLDLTDLRFGVPGAGAFHCVALQDTARKIVESWFTYGSGEELGRHQE